MLIYLGGTFFLCGVYIQLILVPSFALYSIHNYVRVVNRETWMQFNLVVILENTTNNRVLYIYLSLLHSNNNKTLVDRDAIYYLKNTRRTSKFSAKALHSSMFRAKAPVKSFGPNFHTKGLRSKYWSSPCIFQVVATLSTDVSLYRGVIRVWRQWEHFEGDNSSWRTIIPPPPPPTRLRLVRSWLCIVTMRLNLPVLYDYLAHTCNKMRKLQSKPRR
jgi:hypothetical protein